MNIGLICCCSVTQSCLTLCDPIDCSSPGFPVLHHLLELGQTHAQVIIESVMPSKHFILCCPLPLPSVFPSIRVISNESALSNVSGDQSIGASASVLPMNIQDLLPLGLAGWISLQSKGLSRVFSNTTVQKHQFFGAQLSL